MKKIKILQSLNSLGMGGNVIFVMNFYRHIDKCRFQVDFLICDDSKMDFYEEVVCSKSKVYVVNEKKYLARKKHIESIIKDGEYDIVHINSCSFKGLFRIVLPVSTIENVKIIAHSHNPGKPKNTIIDRVTRNIMKKLLSSKIDYGFTCSFESGESKFTRSFIKSDKFYVINNAIDTHRFYYNLDVRNKIRDEYKIDGKLVFGSIGRLESQKNYLFLIDVFNDYIKYDSDAVLLLVGEGSERVDIQKKIKEYDLFNNVILVGKSDKPELYYQAMDIFVLPSIYEGFGFVNIEAQVSGLECIVSDKVPKEVDISGKVSFVKLDKKDWVYAMKKVSSSLKNSERKTLITKEYDLKYETERIEGLYTDLMCT